MYDEDVDGSSEASDSWKVGLWEGACKGFLGSNEIGGEWRTSDWNG